MLKLDSHSETLPALRTKREEYLGEISTRKIECAAIRTRLNQASPESGNDHENRVNALLGRPTAPVKQPDAERLQILLMELNDLQCAVSAVDAAIHTEIRKASVRLCDSKKDEHATFAKAVAQSVIDLQKAHANYVTFIDAINDTGAVTTSLMPIFPTYLGSPFDSSGLYHWTLKEFREGGFVSLKSIPEAVR
jgi:hypothetical protein